MASRNNITCYKGEAIELDFTHRASDSATAAVVDITGWTLSFTLRVNRSDPDPALLTVAGAITAATLGTYTVSLTHAQTNISPGIYNYDVWRTDSGSEATLSIGTFTVTQDVRY